MTQAGPEIIDFSDAMLVSERRVGVLGLLQDSGVLTYWGPREGCYLVVFAERPGQVEALTGADVDRLEFDEFVRLYGQTR